MLKLEFNDRGCTLVAEAETFGECCSILLGQFAERFYDSQVIDLLDMLSEVATAWASDWYEPGESVERDFDGGIDSFTLKLSQVLAKESVTE